MRGVRGWGSGSGRPVRRRHPGRRGRRPGPVAGVVVLGALAVLAGCTAPAGRPDPAGRTSLAATETVTGATGPGSTAGSRVEPPPVHAQVDYQIGGAYPPPAAVGVITRDRREKPVPGRYSICYVNAFQTQPEERPFWDGHPGLLLRDEADQVIEDPKWPGEIVLDTSTAQKRTELAAIMSGWISDCAAKGFRAVEADNLDSASRSGGPLTDQDNLALATSLARTAHGLGLAIGQKNAADLGVAAREQARFDFAVTEECQVYNECARYTGVYGPNVIEIEYTDNGTEAFEQACRAQGQQISVLLRDRNVVPAGSPGYVYRWC